MPWVQVSNEGEKGLLGLAVAPGFPDDSPYFYVYYSSVRPGDHGGAGCSSFFPLPACQRTLKIPSPVTHA